jgi:hypothetical protein
MVLFSAYFDESGTHDGSPAAVVAGFVANASEWTAFSEAWQVVLDKNGITYFRMSEFESFIGRFEEWSQEQHRQCISDLLCIINKHTFWSVGCIVPRSSFDALLTDKAKRICGDAYGLAAIGCFRNLAERIKGLNMDAWIDCTMEHGTVGFGALQNIVNAGEEDPEWLDSNRMSLFSRPKYGFPPLQAADILAYELYKQSDRMFGTEKRRERYPLLKLAQQRYRQWGYVDDDELRKVNEWLNLAPDDPTS